MDFPEAVVTVVNALIDEQNIMRKTIRDRLGWSDQMMSKKLKQPPGATHATTRVLLTTLDLEQIALIFETHPSYIVARAEREIGLPHIPIREKTKAASKS